MLIESHLIMYRIQIVILGVLPCLYAHNVQLFEIEGFYQVDTQGHLII